MESYSLSNRHKALYLFIAVILFIVLAGAANAQQHIIVNKDNTRPETSNQYNSFNLSSFTVIQQNGYNEIQWQALEKNNTDKVIIEYSFDGINFVQGEEVLTNNGIYNYRHYIRDTRPLLYRIRTEDNSGTLNYSGAILPKGMSISPVEVQKNIVQGNVININAQFPVERLTITSGNGLQLFAKDVNGLRDFIPVAIPSLDRGIYFITFYGNGWKSTSRFVVG